MDAMLASMTYRQFIEWVTFADLEPFGEERADVRSAQVAAVIANVNRDPKRTSAFKIEDFMLRFGDYEAPKKTWQQMKQIGRMMYIAFGGKP